MTDLKYTEDGWRNLLDCPRCGDPCKEMPPYPPRHPGGHPTWEEGDTGVCACGAPLEVIVDDGRAWLEVIVDDGRAWLRDDEEDEV